MNLWDALRCLRSEEALGLQIFVCILGHKVSTISSLAFDRVLEEGWKASNVRRL